jgi:protein associated with RNAse G/E
VVESTRVQLVRGQTVYMRHFQRGQVGGLFPLQVVEHRGDGVLLWAPMGTTYWHFVMADGRTMPETPLVEWSAGRHLPAARTIRRSLLSWHPDGADYSIRWFFEPDGGFHAWYANLEEPGVVWRDGDLAGLDTVDWDLDIWVYPDLRWEWKDEELFHSRLSTPDAYWVDDADRVWRAGREVVELVESGQFPFDGTWCDFVPDPAWPPMSRDLPSGWDCARH